MQDKIELIEIARDTYETCRRYGALFMCMLLGVAAKLVTINKEKRITKAQALATIATGVLCGFTSSFVCDYYKLHEKLTYVVVSVSALSGENITAWILVNSKDILNKILKIFVKNK